MSKTPPNTKFKLTVVSPDQVLFEGEATRAMVPGIHDTLAILPDHAPLYAEVLAGEILIDQTSGQSKKIKVENGILRVKQNQVSVVLGFK